MAAIFEQKHTDEQQYDFNFLDSRGEQLLMSGEYESKQASEQAIKYVKPGSLKSNQIVAGKVPHGNTCSDIKDTVGNIRVKSIGLRPPPLMVETKEYRVL